MRSSIVEINNLSFSMALFKWEVDLVSFIIPSPSADAVIKGRYLLNNVRPQKTCTEFASVGCRLAVHLGHSCKSLTKKTNSSLVEWSRTPVNKWKKVISVLQLLDSAKIESHESPNWTTASVYLGSHHRFREGFHRKSLFYKRLNQLRAIFKKENLNPYSTNYRYQEALVCL